MVDHREMGRGRFGRNTCSRVCKGRLSKACYRRQVAAIVAHHEALIRI